MKSVFVLVFLLLALSKMTYADEKPVATDSVYVIVDTFPKYPGGDSALSRFLVKNIKYPFEAMMNHWCGAVIVKFIIDENGKVTNPVVLKDNVGGGAAEEAMRVIQLLPAWIPGKKDGPPVKVYFTIPVKFKLADKCNPNPGIKKP